MKNMMYTALLAAGVAVCPAVIPAAEIVHLPNIFSGETLTHNKLFVPEGPGPFPAVVVMHGVGGLWSNDDVESEEMVSNFEEWAVILNGQGYIALFVDSFTPRSFLEFEGKYPTDKAPYSDAACSDRWVRPTDAYSALAWLKARPDVQEDAVALMGFSHGAQSALASVVDPTIVQHKSNWTLWYEKLQKDNVTYKKQSVPVQAPYVHDPEDGFATVIAYYPGGGFHSYFGSVHATTAKNYMPYCPALMIHGDTDSLYTSGHPGKLLAKSQSHADFLGLPAVPMPFYTHGGEQIVSNNPLQHLVYDGPGHTFDMAQPGSDAYWAKVNARAVVLMWLEETLE